MKHRFSSIALTAAIAMIGVSTASADPHPQTAPVSYVNSATGIQTIVKYLDPGHIRINTPGGEPTIVEIEINGVARQVLVDYSRAFDMTVHFEHNSEVLSGASKTDLDRLGAALNYPSLKMYTYLIAGHADSRGPSNYNYTLSRKRAVAVRNYLVENWLINPARLEVHGWGETRLKNPNSPHSDVNRRVEVAMIIADKQPAHTRISVNGQPVHVIGNTRIDTAYDGHSISNWYANRLCYDPRPIYMDIDDFGGYRTPLTCTIKQR